MKPEPLADSYCNECQADWRVCLRCGRLAPHRSHMSSMNCPECRIQQAIEAEREACAALAETIGMQVHDKHDDLWCGGDWSDKAGEKIADAIRARGSEAHE